MPTYEYACKKCGHEFEAIHSMAAPTLKICPQESCGQKKWGRGAVAKKIGAGAGLIFKGSGFYITDYRSEGYKTAAKNDPKAPASTAKPEAKPAAKPEKKLAKSGG